MYAWHCIIYIYVSISFLSFLLSACLTKRLFSNSSGISFCPDVAYWDNWASASLFVYLSIEKQMSDGNAIWTYFRYFLYCLWPGSFAAEGADVKNACIKSADNACTKGACAKVSCTGGAGGVSAVKDLGIYLQLSWILKLRQYSTRLATKVRVGWLLLGLYWFLYVYWGLHIGWYCWLYTSCDTKGCFREDDWSKCWGVCYGNKDDFSIGNPCRFAAIDSRLLANLGLVISVSSCLRLQMILDCLL